jgi:hypothetical protein
MSWAAGKSIECWVGLGGHSIIWRVEVKCMHATETGKQRPRLPSNHAPSKCPTFLSPPGTPIRRRLEMLETSSTEVAILAYTSTQ